MDNAVDNVTAVYNQKGGVGKTTNTVGLAGALADLGRSVLVIEMDPQGNLAEWFDLELTDDEAEEFAEAILKERDLNAFVRSTQAGFQLIPNGLAFTQYEWGAQNKGAAAHLHFRKVLERFQPERWDHVFIDTPGNVSLIAQSALVAARFVIAPVFLDKLSLGPVKTLLRSIDNVQELNPELTFLGFIASRVNYQLVLTRQWLELLKDTYPDLVWKTQISATVSAAEAPGFAQSITRYAPNSSAAKDFVSLANEFDERVSQYIEQKKEVRSVANV